MDYIPGEDLASLIKNEGAQPLEKVLGWVEQLGAALTYMHEQKPPVIHRDIKPGNIKVTPTGEVVLVDFGIAKASEIGQATATGATGYTPGFAPPEQISRAHTGPYSDQYSLAATIYQLLSGRQPEDGIQRGLGRESLTPIRQLMPRIPAHVEIALSRALSLRPEERFRDIDQFIQAMKDPDYHPAAGPVVERRLGTVKAQKKSRRKWIWLAGLAGLGTLFIGITVAGYFLLPDVMSTISQTPVATMDPIAILATDVAQARMSTQTQAAYLSGLTATARVPTLTPTPEKIILGGGGELAFVSDRGDGKTLQIWTMSVYMNNQSQIITGEARQLTFSEGDKTQPTWSPDGQRIMYVAPGSGRNGLDIWVMAADGSGAIDLTGQPGNELDPAWSSNSAVIAYTKPNEDGSPLIYVMRNDGTSVQLLSEDYQESQPTWSADRQWLVFVMSAKGHEYLNMRGMQGGSLIPVAFDLDSYFGRLGRSRSPGFFT